MTWSGTWDGCGARRRREGRRADGEDGSSSGEGWTMSKSHASDAGST